MTFPTKSRAEIDNEQRQQDRRVAEMAAIRSYTQHPGDNAQAAQSIARTIPWTSDQCEAFIEHYGQGLREQAEALVTEAAALGITPQEVMALKASAAASGITLAEAAAQKAARTAAAASGAKKQTPIAQSMRAAIAAISSYAILPGEDKQAMTAIVWSVSGWSALQADEFISEYGQRLQAITGELQALAAAADRSSAQQSSPAMKRS